MTYHTVPQHVIDSTVVNSGLCEKLRVKMEAALKIVEDIEDTADHLDRTGYHASASQLIAKSQYRYDEYHRLRECYEAEALRFRNAEMRLNREVKFSKA